VRRRLVPIALALLVVGVVIVVVAALVETDEERIEALVESMRAAAERGDVAGVLAGVAPRVAWPGGQEALRRRVSRDLALHPPQAVAAEVSGLEVDGETATGVVVVTYRSREFARPVLVRVRTTFARRDGRWLVTAAEVR
jgi:hypothetical protein